MNYFKYFFYFTLIFIISSSCEIENNPVEIISLTASDSIISSGSSISLLCIAEDGDGDKLRYSWESSLGTIVSGNKDSAIWNAPIETGYHTITCKVSDDNGSSDALGISIQVIANRIPTAYDSTIEIYGNTDYTGVLSASDPDGDPLIFSIIMPPNNGVVSINNDSSGTFTYTPSNGYTGTDSFTYSVSDGDTTSNEATISFIILAPLNYAPIAIDTTFEMITGSSLNSNLSANDPDGDPLIFSIITSPSNGTIDVLDENSGSFTYTPSNGYVGIDNFTFSASDGELTSNEAVITINVNEILGTLQGTITNAINGNSISSVIVSINNMEAITDENGVYTIYTEIISGEYIVNTSSDLFCPYNGAFQISDTYESNIFIFNFSLSPIPEPGEIRMVLNWGEEPSDLDSHLKTPQIEGQEYHIYYANRGNSDSAPYATLDYDVVTGYGPETMTIKQSFTGNYIYYIYQYSSSGSLNESGGLIQIYNSPDCSGQTIYVPDQGSGRYWYVCDINGDSGEVTVINQIQETEPTQ